MLRLFALLTASLALVGCSGGGQVMDNSNTDTTPDDKPMVKDELVSTTSVDYMDGETALEGYLAVPVGAGDRRLPAVMVVHNWMGLSQRTKDICHDLARLGYVAFAADMYGKGVRPTTAQEAGEQAGIYRADRSLMRYRAKAALNWMRGHKNIDASSIAAIGYCFGGGVVLELARSGADVAGVVSFHGNLDTPDPKEAMMISCKVLVLHGADDPIVPQEQVQGFIKEMRAHKIDWQLIQYGGAVHSFTNPGANMPDRGVLYHPNVALRSWFEMRRFFGETIDQ